MWGGNSICKLFVVVWLLFLPAVSLAGNVDPDNDDHKYAWAENTGWVNFNPSPGEGVTVTGDAVTGFAWGENIGWISFSCEDTSTCGDINYGVTNDCSGNLSGFAWAENTGWISFSCENGSSCGAPDGIDYGVKVDPATGLFSGLAWGENIGWINFGHTETDLIVLTAWTNPPPEISFTTSDLTMSENSSDIAIIAELAYAFCNDVTLPFTTSGTASGGTDFTITTSPVTISAGDTTATITVSVTEDDFAEGDETNVVTIGDPVNAVKGPVIIHTVTIQNDDIAGFSVTETFGDTIVSEPSTTDTFSVVLDARPETDVVIDASSSDTGEATISPASLTFTRDDWDVAQTVIVTAANDRYIDGSQGTAISLGVNDASSNDHFDPVADMTVSVTTLDNDTAGFTITESSGTSVDESGTTDSFTVVLDARPYTNVVIDITSADTEEISVDSASLVFTTNNWNVAQPVTLTGEDDWLIDGNQFTSVILSVYDGSSDDNFDSVPDQAVSVTTTDNDTAGFTITETSGTAVDESGTTDSFTVVLDAQPDSEVVINISSADTGEVTVGSASLTFNTDNWNAAQLVTVTGEDDRLIDGNQFTLVILSVNDGSSDDNFDLVPDQAVSVTTTDNDTAGFTITETSGTAVDESGTTDSFTVVLDAQPDSDVVVDIINPDTGEVTTDKDSLIFTPDQWDTGQIVIATGVDDYLVDGDRNTAIKLTIHDSTSDDNFDSVTDQVVNITTTDNDTAGFTIVDTSDKVVDESGSTATFAVVLDARPYSNVVIGVSSSDTSEAVASPGNLTFEAGDWDSPQTVTITGVDDGLLDGAQASTITLAINADSSGDNFDSVENQTLNVTTADDEVDSDSDGIPDFWEEANNFDPANPNDAGLDNDEDGLTNLEEYHNETDPFNEDSDADGYFDGVEVAYGTDPDSDSESPPEPSAIWVDDDWVQLMPGEDADSHIYSYDAFSQIQTAVDEASANIDIYVADGHYIETVFWTKDLEIKGTGDACIINGNAEGPVIKTSGLSDISVLEGITIINGYSQNGGGIHNSGSNFRILNTVIADNNAELNGGGIYNDQSDVTMINCTVSQNSAGISGGAIYNSNSSIVVVNSILWANLPDEISNDTSSSAFAAFSDIQGGYSGNENMNIDPLFAAVEKNDFHIKTGSPCIDTGDDSAAGIISRDFDGETRQAGSVDIGADEFVDADNDSMADYWEFENNVDDPDADLDDDGLSNAQESKYGTDPNDPDSDDDGYLDGLDAGVTELPDELWVNDGWIGLSPAQDVDGHTFGYNAFATIQIAIDIAADDAQIHVEGGTYTENLTWNKNLTIDAIGPGPAIIDGGQAGSVITAFGVSGSVLKGFILRNGYAQYGGGLHSTNSAMSFYNCVFNSNAADFQGGGIYNAASGLLEITNCTFSGNTATLEGGAIYNDSSDVVITNTILWGDLPDEISNGGISASSVTVTYSDVQEGHEGEGNKSSNPRFERNPEPDISDYGDCHLQSASPCIDAGNNNAPNLPAEDIAGNPRTFDDLCKYDTGSGNGAMVDIGAYEAVYRYADSDHDGVLDCHDNCPNDPLKIEPGACGCGIADVDSDNDDTPDCNDNCPNDPYKIEPEACGCGTLDFDSDGDGTVDCIDGCPSDPAKTEPGSCGCGVSDKDRDGDGIADCNDQCPDDPKKLEPGICGCGLPDADPDDDGTPDCNDGCPLDPAKIDPGGCGCGAADNDSDRDGILDCLDTHPNDPDEWADNDGDGIGDNADIDDDNDGMSDDWEIENGLDPESDDADNDSDGDGYSNLEEYENGTDPNAENVGPGKPVPFDPVEGLTDVSLTPNLIVIYEDAANISSHHQTQWQMSLDEDFETLVFEITGDEYLIELPVPDMVLTKDSVCFWRARFIDMRGHIWGWSDAGVFKTLAEPFVDDNFNNIPDDQDIDLDQDLDGNGEVDFSQNGMSCAHLPGQSDAICMYIANNLISIDSLRFVDPGTISDMTNRPDDFPLGLISFRVIVENPGDTMQAVVYFSRPLPIGIGWFIYDTINGWQDFSQNIDFSNDRTSMTLTITDGCLGDADVTANGIIVDFSGSVTFAQEPGSDSDMESGGSDGGCFLQSLAGSLINKK